MMDFQSFGNLVPKGLKTIESLLVALSYVGTAKDFQKAQDELINHMTDATKSLEDMMKPAWKHDASLADSVMQLKKAFDSLKARKILINHSGKIKIDFAKIQKDNIVFDDVTNKLTNLVPEIDMAMENGANKTIGKLLIYESCSCTIALFQQF